MLQWCHSQQRQCTSDTRRCSTWCIPNARFILTVSVPRQVQEHKVTGISSHYLSPKGSLTLGSDKGCLSRNELTSLLNSLYRKCRETLLGWKCMIIVWISLIHSVVSCIKIRNAQGLAVPLLYQIKLDLMPACVIQLRPICTRLWSDELAQMNESLSHYFTPFCCLFSCPLYYNGGQLWQWSEY